MLLLAAACGAPRVTPAPPADFLVSAGDSTYWVTSDSAGLKLRGVPMMLARVDGRFHELYVADDDHSYPDALFVGQRLYRRDLVRGDSVEIMIDTVVPRLALAYAKAHPREAPLGPNEDANDDPSASATADIELLGVHGPYVSFEYHVDLESHAGERRSSYHRVRRGVLDSRTGAPVRLAALVGEAAARAAEAAGEKAWSGARDSIAAGASEEGRRRVMAVAFDARSFSFEAIDGVPQVTFALPGESRGGSAVPAATLTPRAVQATAWWGAVKPELPHGPDSLRTWTRGAVTVVAREEGDGARLLLRDGQRHEFRVGMIAAPVQRIMWLDSTVDAESRKALRRAFSDAAQYSETSRVAAARARAAAGLTALARNASLAPRTPVARALPHGPRTLHTPRTPCTVRTPRRGTA